MPSDESSMTLDLLGYLSVEEKALIRHLFQLGSGGKGFISGIEAAPLLKRSKLPEATLAQIWQLVDKDNQGRLDILKFAKTLRLIALAQQNRPLDQLEMKMLISPPKFEGISLPSAPPTPMMMPTATEVFSITPDEKSRFTEIFELGGARNGQMDGPTAKNIFVKSNLPEDVLIQIWSLVDVKRTGSIGCNQFVLAMALIQKRIKNPLLSIPTTLPPNMTAALLGGEILTGSTNVTAPSIGLDGTARMPPVSRDPSSSGMMPLNVPSVSRDPSSNSLMPPSFAGGLSQSPSGASLASASAWMMTAEDRAKFEGFFSGLDTSKKGYLLGPEAVPFFLKSGLSEPILAEVWNLIDHDKSGRLDKEKFAAGMYLIQKKLAGAPLPSVIPVQLMPSLSQGSSVFGTAPRPSISSYRPDSPTLGRPTSVFGSVSAADVARERQAIFEKQAELAAKQEELLQQQQRALALAKEAEELKSKRIALEETIHGLEKEKLELASSLKSLQLQTDEELNRFTSLQATYIQTQQAIQELKTKYDTEQAELDALKARSSSGAQYLETQRHSLAEAKELLNQASAEKSALESQFVVDRKEYEGFITQLRDIQDQTIAVNDETSKLRIDIEKLKLSRSTKKQEVQTALATNESAKKQLEELQDKKETLSKQPVATPAVMLKTVSGREEDLFGVPWDAVSITSAKSDSHAVPVRNQVTLERKPSAASVDTGAKKAAAIINSTGSKKDDLDDFFGSTVAPANTSKAPATTGFKVFETPMSDSAVPMKKETPIDVTDDFFSASFSAPPTIQRGPKTETPSDPFGDFITAPVASSQPAKTPSPVPTPKTEAVSTIPTANTATPMVSEPPTAKVSQTTSPTGFDVKKAEKEFDSKFPSVDDFEQKFDSPPATKTESLSPAKTDAPAVPKPALDDFDAEFSALEKDANAKVITAPVEVDFDSPFDDMFIAKSEAKVKSETVRAPESVASLSGATTSADGPFKPSTVATSSLANAFSSNFDDPFDFNNSFSNSGAAPRLAAVSSDMDNIFNSSGAAAPSNTIAAFSTNFDDAFTSDPFSNPFESTTAKPAAAPSADLSFFDAATGPISSTSSKQESRPSHPNPVAVDTSFFETKPAEKLSNPQLQSPAPSSVSPTSASASAAVAEIIAMGFTEDQAKEALARYDNDTTKAINFLLDGGSTEDFEETSSKQEDKSTKSPEQKKSSKWWKSKKKKDDASSVKSKEK